MEQNGPVNLFRFVINPSDFAQSVENMFYLSFLIRDGECALEIEEDGEPVICALVCFASRSLALAHTCTALTQILNQSRLLAPASHL
jgi:non-structural maintenance of chromosomes element 4